MSGIVETPRIWTNERAVAQRGGATLELTVHPWSFHVPSYDPRMLVKAEWHGDPHARVYILQEHLDDLGLLTQKGHAPEVLTAFPWRLRFIERDITTLSYVYMREDAFWRCQRLRVALRRMGWLLRDRLRQTARIWGWQ